MIEQFLDIAAADGACPTFVCHPERGGPHPVVLLYMDALGIREELRDMARRLATVGYFVVLPNLYCRSGVDEPGPLPPTTSEHRERIVALMNGLNISTVMSDSAALLRWLDRQPEALASRVGTVGYCMSGQYAITAAASFPDRIRAAASIYGTQLVTERGDSPHVVARRSRGELYFAFAENDCHVAAGVPALVREALRGSNVNAEVEVHAGVEHGFAFPQRTTYMKAAARRVWERLFSLYRRRFHA